MTDIQIAADRRGLRRWSWAATCVLCDRVRVNVLEIVAGVAALFVFVYLLWALLRPEDF